MKATLLIVSGLLLVSLSYSQSITVTCSGNVGIGCTPGYKFDVTGNSRFQGNVGIGCAPTSYKFDVNGNTRFQSNVGIGRAPSTYKLDVFGTSRFDGNVDIGSTSTPARFFKMNTSMQLTTILQDYPEINAGWLGTSDDQWGFIYGEEIYADGQYLGSDLRLKENIQNIDNSLEKIKLLRPVIFDFKPIPVPNIPEWKEYVIEKNLRRKDRTGFIAQEVLNCYSRYRRIRHSGRQILY